MEFKSLITPHTDRLLTTILSHRLVLAIFLLSGSHLCTAQLKVYPLQRTSVKSTGAPRASGESTARTKQTGPLTLPFWDDFSNPYKDQYPDILLWDSSYTVWVNNGMAINPPTINVATFDGLDSAGLAYNANEILLNGFTDSLVSLPVNLGETGDGAVLVSERSSVYLSFFYQWQGNGEAPDEEDYILVEFRNNENAWEPVLTIEPKLSFKRDVFYDTIIQVSGDQFFHNAFQFRFRTFGRQSGPYDTWNLDYVYLNKGRSIDDLSFPDRAMASGLGGVFEKYTSIPLNHFLQNKQLTTPSFEISNLKNTNVSLNYNAEATITNYIDGSPLQYSLPLGPFALERQGSDTSGVLLGYERKTITTLKLPNVALFEPDADSIFFNLKVILNSGDNKFNRQPPLEEDSIGDYDLEKYWPIKFTANDTIETTFTLSSHYAYDDGVAEYAAGLIAAGNLVAYEFELPDGLPDTLALLKSFDIYFPPYGLTSNQTVDFFIYHEQDGKPGEQWLRIPSRRIERKGINQFQSIEFLPALQVTEKKFYIGWKQPVTGELFVGLDINNDTSDKLFVNTNGSWKQNTTVTGSFMLRPVFGTGIVDPTTGIEDEVQFAVYPNPTPGNFYIDGQPDRLEILSITGQPVSFRSERRDEKTIVYLNQPPGLYLLRCTKGTVTKTHKLLVTQ